MRHESGKLFEAVDVLRQKARELRSEAELLDKQAENLERRANEIMDGHL
jgi:predicted ribosome quality control (RQC) complex YloA/Tae2 family protein